MVLKLIFLIMLCVPVAYGQYLLVLSAASDLKKSRKSIRRSSKPVYGDYSFESNYLKAVK